MDRRNDRRRSRRHEREDHAGRRYSRGRADAGAAGRAGVADGEAEASKGVKVKVMTRNMFLGADLGPALESTGFESFIEANGGILREVDLTNFPLRRRGWRGRSREKKPDLVGLQEVALWRTGPVQIRRRGLAGGPFGALTVEVRLPELLLDQLRRAGMNYKVVVVKDEFDFEAPADQNDVDNGAARGQPDRRRRRPLDDAELNGRLTMRDVILVHEGLEGRRRSRTRSGNYENLLVAERRRVIDVPVTRGWTAGDAVAKKGKGKNR